MECLTGKKCWMLMSFCFCYSTFHPPDPISLVVTLVPTELFHSHSMSSPVHLHCPCFLLRPMSCRALLAGKRTLRNICHLGKALAARINRTRVRRTSQTSQQILQSILETGSWIHSLLETGYLVHTQPFIQQRHVLLCSEHLARLKF